MGLLSLIKASTLTSASGPCVSGMDRSQVHVGSGRIWRRDRALRSIRAHMAARHCSLQQVSMRIWEAGNRDVLVASENVENDLTIKSNELLEEFGEVSEDSQATK